MKLIKTLVIAAAAAYVVKHVYDHVTRDEAEYNEGDATKRRVSSFQYDDSYEHAGSHGDTIQRWTE